MRQQRLVRVLTMIWIILLPAAAGADVSDWYGTWQSAYAGDTSGDCTVTVSAGNASQASVGMSCTSSVGDPPFSGTGSITARGSFTITGSTSGSLGADAMQLFFGGTFAGDSGQGQWTSATQTPFGTVTLSGTWTTTRITPPQPVAINPEQPVVIPPQVQTEYTVSVGQLPEAAVTTSVTGTITRASLTVTLDLSRISVGALSAPQGRFAAGYSVFVAVLLPAGVSSLTDATWFVLHPAPGGWAMLAHPIAAYLQGVAQSAASTLVSVSILENVDLSALLGSEIYVGYGLDSDEMLAQRRYRGVFIVR